MSMTMDETRQEKQVLRREIRSRVKGLSVDDIASQSAKVWERLFALPAYQEAKSVGLFLSMPTNEICTDLALADAIRKGKTVYVPEVGQNFELCDMELIRVVLGPDASGDNDDAHDKIFHHNWPRNKWGIPEPPATMPRITAEPGDIDLLVVPGLAFDANGGRLGQGKGYYDRFIARMRQHSKPKLVAVGLEPQLLDRIPIHEHDFQMDIVLLPNATLFI